MRFNQFFFAVGIVLTCLAGPAHADQTSGFAITDFTKGEDVALTVEGKRFARSEKPQLLRFTCRNCRGVWQNVDIVLGKSPEGSEARFRSGERTVAMMESECKLRDPKCTVEAIAVNGAVGWLSRSQFGKVTFDITVLYKNGDQLAIQSLSYSPDEARSNGKAVTEQIAPLIIGPN